MASELANTGPDARENIHLAGLLEKPKSRNYLRLSFLMCLAEGQSLHFEVWPTSRNRNPQGCLH